MALLAAGTERQKDIRRDQFKVALVITTAFFVEATSEIVVSDFWKGLIPLHLP